MIQWVSYTSSDRVLPHLVRLATLAALVVAGGHQRARDPKGGAGGGQQLAHLAFFTPPWGAEVGAVPPVTLPPHGALVQGVIVDVGAEIGLVEEETVLPVVRERRVGSCVAAAAAAAAAKKKVPDVKKKAPSEGRNCLMR